MSEKRTQYTPKGHEIPIPKRRDFDRMLHKAATTQVPEEPKPKLRRRSARRPAK